MTLKFHKVVTRHGATRVAVVVREEQIATASRQVKAGLTGSEMWSADRIPVTNSKAMLDPQHAASRIVSTGTTISATAKTLLFGSNCSRRNKPVTRFDAESFDYATVLSNTFDMGRDEDRAVVLQRGTRRASLCTGDVAAGPAFILIDTRTVIPGDNVPRTFHPDPV